MCQLPYVTGGIFDGTFKVGQGWAWTARDQYLQAALAGELKLADPLFKYVPFDISESAMAALVESLEELFPGLEVN